MTDKTEAREIAEQIGDGFFPSSLSDQASEQIVGATVIMIEVALSAARREGIEAAAKVADYYGPNHGAAVARQIRELPDTPEGETT